MQSQPERDEILHTKLEELYEVVEKCIKTIQQGQVMSEQPSIQDLLKQAENVLRS